MMISTLHSPPELPCLSSHRLNVLESVKERSSVEKESCVGLKFLKSIRYNFHSKPFKMKTIIALIQVWTFLFLYGFLTEGMADVSDGHLSLPNRDTGKSFERILGLGISLPYPYYQKPKYRYPVYDSSGKGRLLYGYGGKETFQYKEFTPIEGHY